MSGCAAACYLRRVAHVTLYVKHGCPHCDARRSELRARGARFTEIDVGRHPEAVPELLKLTKADSARALVLMRSDDVTQIAAKDDAELLDADFHGTLLSTEECDLLWTLQALSAAFGGLLKTALSTPPSPMPALPSGNGIEGGVFHSSFQFA